MRKKYFIFLVPLALIIFSCHPAVIKPEVSLRAEVEFFYDNIKKGNFEVFDKYIKEKPIGYVNPFVALGLKIIDFKVLKIEKCNGFYNVYVKQKIMTGKIIQDYVVLVDTWAYEDNKWTMLDFGKKENFDELPEPFFNKDGRINRSIHYCPAKTGCTVITI